MTKKELSQLYYLNKEIRNYEKRMVELRAAATSTTSRMSGMPHGGGRSDKTAIAAEIADLQKIIDAKREECIAHYNRIMRYVNTIDDSMMRQIILYRHADMLSWQQIAQKIGGGNTADGIRMAHKRFLSRCA